MNQGGQGLWLDARPVRDSREPPLDIFSEFFFLKKRCLSLACSSCSLTRRLWLSCQRLSRSSSCRCCCCSSSC